MRTRLLGVGFYAFVAVLTLLLCIPFLNLTDGHLTVPFDYTSDALAGATHLKNVIEHGWIDYYPAVGAPEGRHGNDYPITDNLHLGIAWLLGLLDSRWAVVLNTYFVLTFPLAAMSAAWFLRVVGLRRVTAAAFAVLYAFAPYHFLRGEVHLFLSAYYVVPYAGILLHRAVSGEALWARRSTRWLPLRWCRLRNLQVVLGIGLLATASAYYALFALFLLSFAGTAALLQGTGWRRFAGVCVAQAWIVAVMVANLLPSMLYSREHGANPAALIRAPGFTERQSLKLTSLLLPAGDHRIEAFAELRRRYDEGFPVPGEHPALGVIAAMGLVLLLGIAVLGMATVLRRRRVTSVWWTRQRRLAVLAASAFVLGTIGGGSSLFALFVSDNVRGWNRISIYLALLCLASAGLVVDRIADGAWRKARVPTAAVLSIALLTLGIFDQSPRNYPHGRSQTVASWESDTTFVHGIEQVLPAGSVVLQLPYLSYPEALAVVRTTDSDPFRMYLHSSTLRWTYGGFRGRPEADWSAAISQEPLDRLVALTAAAGLKGIQVDRLGYADEGVELEGGLANTLHVTPLVSPDERFSFWDLSSYRASQLQRRPAALLAEVAVHVLRHPVGYGEDFDTDHPRVLFDNPLSTPQTVNATVGLVSTDYPSLVSVTWPDGVTVLELLREGQVEVSRRLTLPPGRSYAEVRTPVTATSRRDSAQQAHPERVRFRLVKVALPDEVIASFHP